MHGNLVTINLTKSGRTIILNILNMRKELKKIYLKPEGEVEIVPNNDDDQGEEVVDADDDSDGDADADVDYKCLIGVDSDVEEDNKNDIEVC